MQISKSSPWQEQQSAHDQFLEQYEQGLQDNLRQKAYPLPIDVPQRSHESVVLTDGPKARRHCPAAVPTRLRLANRV